MLHVTMWLEYLSTFTTSLSRWIHQSHGAYVGISSGLVGSTSSTLFCYHQLLEIWSNRWTPGKPIDFRQIIGVPCSPHLYGIGSGLGAYLVDLLRGFLLHIHFEGDRPWWSNPLCKWFLEWVTRVPKHILTGVFGALGRMKNEWRCLFQEHDTFTLKL